MNQTATLRSAGAVTGGSEHALPGIVLLPGWGSNAGVMDEFARLLGAERPVSVLDLPGFGEAQSQSFPREPAQRIEWLRGRVPRGEILVGWSLGGALALEFACACPAHLGAVVTIATNPCFVRKSGWSQAMDQSGFESFRAAMAETGVAGLARFAALQVRGDARPREVLRRLRETAAARSRSSVLLDALDVLATLDLRAGLGALTLPVLHVLGEQDALVPCAVSADYLQMQPDSSVWLAEGSAHAPFLSRPAAVSARILQFIHDALDSRPAVQRNKAEVARSFGRAAHRYEKVAHLQRATGRELLGLMPALRPATILDLGCGTGFFASVLAACHPDATVIGLDIAEPMLHEVCARHGSAVHSVCADAEHLPLADGAVDLVFSNLALQWCEDLPAALCEIRRVLAADGCALICTLGADTLWELRAAWRAVDQGVHVNHFADTRSIVESAHAAGLRVSARLQRTHLLHYPDVTALARELRELGAHNVNSGRRNGLSGRAVWRSLQNAYDPFAGVGGLPATYEAVFLRLEALGD